MFIEHNINFMGSSSLANTAQRVNAGMRQPPAGIPMSKFDAAANIASTVSGIGSTVASTLFAISDGRKRAEFQESLQRLSLQQMGELERDIASANTVTERIRLLSQAATMIGVAEVNRKLAKKPQNDTKQMLFIIGGGFAVLLGVVIIKLLIRR